MPVKQILVLSKSFMVSLLERHSVHLTEPGTAISAMGLLGNSPDQQQACKVREARHLSTAMI